jgi:hypothetical protein
MLCDESLDFIFSAECDKFRIEELQRKNNDENIRPINI